MSINIASEIVHFAGHIAGSPTPAAGTIYLASNADRCSVSSFWAGGLPWHLPALVLVPPVMCSLPGCAGGWGSTGGVYRERRWWGGSIVSVEKIQKRRFPWFVPPTPTPPSQIRTHPIVQVAKNSEKYKKAPFGT